MPTLTEQAAALLGLTITPQQAAQFEDYRQALIEWNANINLTAITETEAVQVRHFLDSLTVIRAAPMLPGLRLIDVGTGAGFPGLPLRIVFPEIDVTLLEATGKKVAFLQHVVDRLGLDHAAAVQGRAEDAGHDPAHRAAYDVVVARAVARLPALLEYLLPFAKVGGVCIAMKGRTAHSEADDAAHALKTLGGRLKGIETVDLPGVDEPHHLVVVEKVAPTPRDYPRKPGIPTRQPL